MQPPMPIVEDKLLPAIESVIGILDYIKKEHMRSRIDDLAVDHLLWIFDSSVKSFKKALRNNPVPE